MNARWVLNWCKIQLAADFQTKMAAFKSEEESKDRIGDAGESESIMDAIKTTLDVIQEEPGAPTKRLVPSSSKYILFFPKSK